MLAITLGAAQRHDVAIVYPLLHAGPVELGCVALADALASGDVAITEAEGGARVPDLLAKNAADQDVLILDGEQLVGARQNRTTNRSILLPARSTLTIPVSCMEQGRWRPDTDTMSATPYSAPPKVRRHARTAEAKLVATGAAATPDHLAGAQSAVWDEIAGLHAKHGTHSRTGALDDVYAQRRHSLDSLLPHFPALPHQVGLLALTPYELLGLDLIGGHVLYARLHTRLLAGYLLDALAGPTSHGAPADTDAAERFVRDVGSATRTPAPTVGTGEYLVLGGAIVGGALELDGRTVHVSAFPPRDEQPRVVLDDSAIMGPHARRARRR